MKAWQIIILVIVLCLVSFIGGEHYFRYRNLDSQSDTLIVYTTIHDTVKLVEYKERIRFDTVRLAVVPSVERLDSVKFHNDSALVQVPIERKVYETMNYRAVIEGYHPELKSIDIYQKTQTINNTNTVKQSHWGFGFSLGMAAGYFFTPAGWQPGIGAGGTIGVIYRF